MPVPPPVLDADPEAVLARMVADDEARAGRPLGAGDPVRILYQSVADELGRTGGLVNAAHRQNYARLASGAHLEGLYGLTGVARAEPRRATCSVFFYRAAGVAGPVVVPAGTRVALLDAVFETEADVAIETLGQLAEAPCVATSPGASANGFQAGAEVRVLDAVAGVGRAQLAAATQGGAERELDDELRVRGPLGLTQLSAGGTKPAYRLRAIEAHPEVRDAAVSMPELSRVRVTVVGRDGALPSDAAVAAVLAALTDDRVRVMGDRVEVAAPVVLEVEVALTWNLAGAYSAQTDDVERAVLAAVADYVRWQEGGLGRDVLPSELVARVQTAHPGVHAVAVERPLRTAVADDQVVRIAPGRVNVNLGEVNR